MTTFAVPPIDPMSIRFEGTEKLVPEGPVLTRRLSDLQGLFARDDERAAAAAQEDRVVYTVSSSPVPELPRELPQSITTIQPGTVAGEFFMTKGHQHPDPQGEIYLGLRGVGGLLMFDGETTRWVDMAEGVIGYIPPGWAHRSINVGDEPYSFLAVYPGSAGHDYQWVLDHGMGQRAMAGADGLDLVAYTAAASAQA